jgi:hypothetical protein
LEALFDCEGFADSKSERQSFPVGAVSHLSDSMTAPLFPSGCKAKYFAKKTFRICGDEEKNDE